MKPREQEPHEEAAGDDEKERHESPHAGLWRIGRLLALHVSVDAPLFVFFIASMVMWLALLWWAPTRP
jgi:hypothetical protein